MIEGFSSELKEKYRNIFIVDSINYWNKNNKYFNKDLDLVLTYDLKLFNELKQKKVSAFFIDHLVSCEKMQKNNFIAYKFFNDWHYNLKNEDIFTFKNIPFGLALRQEFWNDYIFYIRLYLCLTLLTKITFDKLFCHSVDSTLISILDEMKIEYEYSDTTYNNEIIYYFPIAQWIDERIRPTGLRVFLRNSKSFVTSLYGRIRSIIDKLFFNKNPIVFIQEYHPTVKILSKLRDETNVNVLLENFSKNSSLKQKLLEKVIPINNCIEKYEDESSFLINKFNEEKYKKLILDDGSDITILINNIIIQRISSRLPTILRTLDSCITYHKNNKVDLEILIANIGHTSTLFDSVCKARNIPSYMIINGMLGAEYLDEAKYATYINSYSKSIKDNYFKGMNNIVVLGDSRMDNYSLMKQNIINRETPSVTIGASGFNALDLNSYVAIEFDFLYDILYSFKTILEQGVSLKINLKVRSNGYAEQYKTFVKEFFPNLKVNIFSVTPMLEVLKQTDFYISINSQTLFEASCLGIPVVYYKKDVQIIDPPFDNNSELTTVSSIDTLKQAFYDFLNNHERYDSFLDKKIMEKYIGPLDGKNLERNLEYIDSLLKKGTYE